MLPSQSGSLWRVSLFGSPYFTVCKNRYTHSLIIPQYLVGSSAVKKAKPNATVLCSNFLSNNSGILTILSSSESLRLDLSFLQFFFFYLSSYSSKTTVPCCSILTFWSNLPLPSVLEAILNPKLEKSRKIR